jgi:hypothetical protein
MKKGLTQMRNASKTTRRIIFYVLVFAAVFIVVYKFFPPIAGNSGFRLFFYISALAGLIQTVNLSIFKKSEDIRAAVKLYYFAKLRLKADLKERRESAFMRSVSGIAHSLVAAMSASLMSYYDSCPVPAFIISAALLSTLASIFMLFLTLFEFKNISDIEFDLIELQDQEKTKQEALESLKGSPQNE